MLSSQRSRVAAIVLMTALAGGAYAQSTGGIGLLRSVLGGGGGRSGDAEVAVRGSIGQSIAGLSAAAGLRLSSGFWWPARAVPWPDTGTAPSTAPASATNTPEGLATGTTAPGATASATTPSPGPGPTSVAGTPVWLPIAWRGQNEGPERAEAQGVMTDGQS